MGVGGVITNNRKKAMGKKKYNKFFGLNAELSWISIKPVFSPG